MKRFKISFRIIVLVAAVIVVVVTASKVSSQEPELASANVPPKEKLVKQALEKQKANKRYNALQQKLNKALHAYFVKKVAAGDIVGAGVSIVKGDSILVSNGFGKRNVNEKRKVDGETVFRLGSLSKGFAGVLAADFQAKNKFDWTDKVSDYIPQFQLGGATNTAKIKISHILSHSSGAPYHSYTNLVEDGLTVSDIAGRFDKVKPQSAPGEQYSYQNAMFSLIQEVFLKTSKQDVKVSLQDRFFTPLNMTSISMNHEALLKEENVAIPHVRASKGWKSRPLTDRYYNAVVAGGINASSSDMAKWMRFLLGHNPDVMSSDAINTAFQPVMPLAFNNKYYQRWSGHLKSFYGYGWRIHQFQDTDSDEKETIWHHGGSVNNYRNEIALFPKEDIGICVLLNSNSAVAKTVIPDLHKLVKEVYK